MKNTKMISLLVPIISVILAFLIGYIIMGGAEREPCRGAAGSLEGRLRQRKEHRHHALPLHPADIHRPLRLLCL